MEYLKSDFPNSAIKIVFSVHIYTYNVLPSMCYFTSVYTQYVVYILLYSLTTFLLGHRHKESHITFVKALQCSFYVRLKIVDQRRKKIAAMTIGIVMLSL